MLVQECGNILDRDSVGVVIVGGTRGCYCCMFVFTHICCCLLYINIPAGLCICPVTRASVDFSVSRYA